MMGTNDSCLFTSGLGDNTICNGAAMRGSVIGARGNLACGLTSDCMSRSGGVALDVG